MNKISEQKAQKEYPKDKLTAVEVVNRMKRFGYIQGYDQAMQDFVEKAEIYLKTRVYYNMHPNNITTAIQEFKNYMQDEN